MAQFINTTSMATAFLVIVLSALLAFSSAKYPTSKRVKRLVGQAPDECWQRYEVFVPNTVTVTSYDCDARQENGNYPTNVRWYLNVYSQENAFLNIEYDMDIESQPDCSSDSLTFGAYVEPARQIQLCGTQRGKFSVRLDGQYSGEYYLRFISDGSVTGRGFNITITSDYYPYYSTSDLPHYNEPAQCFVGRPPNPNNFSPDDLGPIYCYKYYDVYPTNSAIINSSAGCYSVEGLYPNNAAYYFTIMTVSDVYLNFEYNVDIESSDRCVADNLTFGEMYRNTDMEVITICGTQRGNFSVHVQGGDDMMPVMDMTQAEFNIVLTSNRVDNGRGFNLTVTADSYPYFSTTNLPHYNSPPSVELTDSTASDCNGDTSV